ncbi:BTAD domain-containing putative transcriptional regulator [Nocardioides humilatus]|nr:BTAD domain-containing putative transcriptional regulator [Nocardioides humilatus]
MLVLVLGALEVLFEDIGIQLTGQKERCLFAILVAHERHVVSATTLLPELWPDGAPESALAGIHVFVSRLRRQLGDVLAPRLTTSGKGYVFDLADHESDMGQFTALVAAGRRSLDRGEPDEAASQIRSGLALWRGDAFADISSPMLRAEATRLADHRSSALESLFDAELAAGRSSELVPELDHLINEHPFHERFWAQRMLALYRSGRQADALASYQALRALTVEELGFEPTPELRRLESAILSQDPALDRNGGAPVVAGNGHRSRPPTDVLPLPPALANAPGVALVGRDAEVRRLATVLATDADRPAGVVLLAGDPGIGKSRLMTAVARDAGADRHVLFGRCDEEPLTPYQPFSEGIRWLLKQHPVRSYGAEVDEDVLDRVGALIGLNGTSRASAQPDRLAAFDAVADLLRALARTRPVVLALEDLHWADAPTLALLRYLVRRLEGEQFVVLATCRTHAIDAPGPTADVIADLRRTATVDIVEVAGLPLESSAELAAVALGREVEEQLVVALHEETAGNPLFLLELARHLDEAGRTRSAPSRTDIDLVRGAAVPLRIRQVVARRVTKLGEDIEQVLGVASVIGREFDLTLVAEAAERSPKNTAEILSRAVDGGLVHEVPGVPGRYAFAHALVRRSLHDQLSTATRPGLHQLIGLLLEESGSGTPAQLARHFHEAAALGDVEKAMRYSRLAAIEAQRALAFEDAIELLERALLLAESRGTAHDRADLLIELGAARWWVGDGEGAEDACRQALVLARAERDGELFARAVLGRWRNNGAATQGFAASAPDTELEEELQEALAGLTEHPSLRAALLGRLGIVSYWSAPVERRRELSDSAVALARASGDDEVLLDALTDRQLALWVPGWEEQRIQGSEEILMLARRLKQPAREADAHIFSALDQLCLADVESADDSIRRYLHVSARLRQPYYRWHAHFLPALRAMMSGRFDEAERLSQAGVAEGVGSGTEGAAQLHGLQTLWLFFEWGRLHELAPLIDDVGISFGEIPALDAARTWIAAECGEHDKARGLLADFAATGFDKIKQDIAWLAALSLLASAAATVGDRKAAQEIHDLLAPHAGRNGLVWVGFCSGPVDFYLGLLADVLGSTRTADQHFGEAHRLATAMGAQPLALRAALERARIGLGRKTTAAKALVELARIREAAGDLGMAGLAQRAADLIGRAQSG